VFGAYSCRSVDNIAGARLSEHAFGNALDVSGFTLADGRTLEFVRDWKRTDTQEAVFLHETHAGACQYFTTVLGPGADVFHYNHIHLDLANHGATNTGPRRICKPTPGPVFVPPSAAPDGLPPAPEVEEPLDISSLRDSRAVALAPPASLAGPGEGPDGALPPSVREADPVPPILPAGAGPGIDTEPTSSTGASDD
jgi:Extensin-like protein C-terminus